MAVAREGEDVGGDTVEKPAVVADDHGAASRAGLSRSAFLAAAALTRIIKRLMIDRRLRSQELLNDLSVSAASA